MTAQRSVQDEAIASLLLAGWINVQNTPTGVSAQSKSGRADIIVFISQQGSIYSVKIKNAYTNREYLFGISTIAEFVGAEDNDADSQVLSIFTPSHAIEMMR